jgi:hypothetical protein
VRSWILAGALIATAHVASARQAQPVEIAVSAGRVTLSAADVPVADVLAAWTRAGHAQLTGAEYLGARRITIHITDADEGSALQAIVGSPGWYTTVARQAPAASDSIFQRIAILPAALVAANPSTAPEPEKLYAYTQVPEPEGRVQEAAPPAPLPEGPKRPPNVEPEAFYHYDAELPNANGEATLTTAPGQPLPQAAVPEEVYSYTATPEPREPVVASNVIPPPPTVEPEVRFAYTPTPEPPSLVPRELVVPSLPMFEGWTGLRLPGRVIRYITQ